MIVAMADCSATLFGNFNLSIDWFSPTSGTPHCKKVNSDSWFLDNFLHALGLAQHNMHPTRGDNYLEYVVSTHKSVAVFPKLNFFPSDHDSLSVLLPHVKHTKRETCQQHEPASSLPQWKNASWDEIRQALHVLPWCLLRLRGWCSELNDWRHTGYNSRFRTFS